ncbi:peptidase M16 [Clostridium polyendosporum]|uniref:Peptidase M16 n=1 Tax=Clostridium polyendosporum TaxID=69208 RepID=A0A919S121_9CLOT|nr:pitrilysin family protein [Clostridium polyendosporum]GIM28658.1 peptidase M16 [Clostridium polyendosporum]
MNKWNFDTKITMLPNGLQVITIKKDTQISSINLGIKIGALYESYRESGICHFIEHMLFKGTANRSNEELNDELENLGGEYNAYTDYTATVYSITCLEEEMGRAAELLSDMVINPTFEEEELEKERGVILAEIKTSKDDIEDLSFKRINEIAFEKAALKYEISGSEDSVISFKKEDLTEFYRKFYTPDNAIITLVTSLEHEDALAIIERYFSSWNGKKKQKKTCILEKNKKCTKVTYKRDIEQSTIMYLFTFHGINKEQELPLKILNHKLGESANSILFRELRENRGLVYDVYTHMDMSTNIKTLYIFTSVSEENVDEVIDVIDECIEKIKRQEIIFDDGILSLMKKVHKTAVISTLEDSSDLGSYVLHQSLEDEDIKEFITDMRRLDVINSDDIYEVARKVLKSPTIHILKPEREEEDEDE